MAMKHENLKFISIAILTYNRCEILEELLKSLSMISYPYLEIIIVDNCSEDETRNIVKERYGNFKYHRSGCNIGVAARNIALRMAKGDIVVTIDDDIFGIDDDAIEKLIEFFSKNQNVGALNFRVYDYFTREICNWIHHKKIEDFNDREFLTYEISEGAVAFSKKALEMSGLYPEYFFLSHEGPDLAFRVINSGMEVRYSPIISVYHLHAKSGRKSWYRYFYDTRNQFLFAMRNLPIFYGIKYLFKGMLTTFIYSIRDGYFMYWLKGIFEGISKSIKYRKDRSVVSPRTMKIVYEIDKYRPSITYMLKMRLFKKDMRL